MLLNNAFCWFVCLYDSEYDNTGGRITIHYYFIRSQGVQIFEGGNKITFTCLTDGNGFEYRPKLRHNYLQVVSHIGSGIQKKVG